MIMLTCISKIPEMKVSDNHPFHMDELFLVISPFKIYLVLID